MDDAEVTDAPTATDTGADAPTTADAPPEPREPREPREPLVDRVFEAGVAAMECLSIHLGDRLGWYRELAASGPLSPADLAARTRTQERYAREWCEQQAVSGFLVVEGTGLDRRFGLDDEGVSVFTGTDSTDYLAPFARLVAATAVQMPALLDAYRDGGGVSWQQLGDDARTGQADMNRPWFEHVLPGELADVPHLDEILSRPGTLVADIGCGFGWSTIALARAYPQARFVGVDVDLPSVESARANAVDAGVTNATFVASWDDAPAGPYDLAFLFECLHDMPQPVDVLVQVRDALADDGRVVVMDEDADDAFTAPGDQVQRALYGFSILCCLPDSLSHTPTVGTGTVMRRGTLARYARQAGFDVVEDLPIEDFGFWRFSELR
jgi:SAM-dependent methyltransferase